jgi:hypothetical protein
MSRVRLLNGIHGQNPYRVNRALLVSHRTSCEKQGTVEAATTYETTL